MFPVAKVDPAVDKKEQNYVPLNDNDKTIRDEFDPVAEANAPVGLQLVDRRFQEEKIPALVEMLSTALGMCRVGAVNDKDKSSNG